MGIGAIMCDPLRGRTIVCELSIKRLGPFKGNHGSLVPMLYKEGKIEEKAFSSIGAQENFFPCLVQLLNALAEHAWVGVNESNMNTFDRAAADHGSA